MEKIPGMNYFSPIGYVRSPLKSAEGSPLQPRFASQVTGTIEIDPLLDGATKDLDGFSRIWVIYACHRSGPAALEVTPYRDNQPHGVFATRVPARPNPIGMSAVRLLKVEGNVLTVGDLDILDGAPVIDIKPYVPEYDAYPDERVGWLATAARRDQHVGDARCQAPAAPAAAPSASRVFRVAVGSRDGKTVHEHFGKATMFQILDIENGVARFVESRPNVPTCRGGMDPDDAEPHRDLPDSIADCCAVVVAAIGPGARDRLKRAKISAFVERDFIDAALVRVAAKLAEK
jgi:tRNA-Thr(GGU) m(6)t(6)A37 methyltransferase TsaA